MNAWISDFLEFCHSNDIPADFISTHHYPTDAFGRERDVTETQLSKSRRSALRDQACKVRHQAASKPGYYTEWNTSSNPRDPLHDEPYAAAFAIKTIMEGTGLFKVTVIGLSLISLKKTIFRPCHFMVVLACSIFMESPSLPIGPMNCCTALANNCYEWTAPRNGRFLGYSRGS